MERLKNEKLTLLISEHGAELQSIRDAEGKEYLWEGDKRYWGGQSPLLFPIVGRLHEDAYNLNGQRIEMQHHGFARHKDFKLIAKGEKQVVFGLNDDAETYKAYPYHFNLAVSYKLIDNKIVIRICFVGFRLVVTLLSMYQDAKKMRRCTLAYA